MMRLEFLAEDIGDMRMQLARALSDLTVNGPVPPPGYGISALGGLNQAQPIGGWEQGRQIGFRQGYERGLAERPRPADYPVVAEDHAVFVPTTDYPLVKDPGPGLQQQAEANRKTNVAVGQARAEYYAEREGKQMVNKVPLGTGDVEQGPEEGSCSSPENVARALRAKHHDHIGMTD
jgi:hypothetical protein